MTVQHITTGSALAITGEQSAWSPQQEAALRQIGLEEASAGDLAVFLHQCQRSGLDPFARQIYMIGRQQSVNVNGRWVKETKYTIQTGIDGFRLVAARVAQRTGESWGYEDTLWCGQDGIWRDVWLSSDAPAAAKVTIVRNGARFSAVAMFREYAGRKSNGELTKMWDEKGAGQIAKCAEALALRKAFPQDLSGLYTSDEMHQVGGDTAQHTVTQAPAQKAAPRGAAGIIAKAQQVSAPSIDWLSRVDAATTTEQAGDLWREASAAGALDDNLRELITNRVADIKTDEQVDPATGELPADVVDADVVDDAARLGAPEENR